MIIHTLKYRLGPQTLGGARGVWMGPGPLRATVGEGEGRGAGGPGPHRRPPAACALSPGARGCQPLG